jgi:alginate O-acetyltransferase complex protein AlgI
LAFNSVDFLIFFPIVTFIYFMIPHKYRWVWLLASSYYFYMSWNEKYVVLMVTTTVITYFSGLLIEKANGIDDDKKSIRLKKFWVFASFACNIGILFLFKYFKFFSLSLTRSLSLFNISITMPTFNFLLPLGISFYTFKSLSYIMDLYRNDIKAEKNIGKFALYISFFPQILAGPIEKSKHMMHQFYEEHSYSYHRIRNGLLLMLWGYFQKVLVADRLALLVNTVYNDPQNYKGFEIIIATVFYAFQIYFDFSSLSDIAIGACEVLGFRISKNFERPYFSKSIKEFWRRWHISLCSWFKDYLYIPLGGNRRGKLRTYINIMIVFLVSGLWHGAAINFVIWGGLHGIYQIAGDILQPIRKKAFKAFNIKKHALSYRIFQILFTFMLVDFAWIFFRANKFSDAVILLKNMMYFNPWVFTDGSLYNLGLNSKNFLVAVLGISVILIVNLIQRTKSVRIQLYKQDAIFRWALYLTVVVIILIFGIYGPDYNAKQFIYMQF